MAVTRTRYPGVQPFPDDPFSQRIFFGRQQESKALADQIVANRLVVVYAKSGLGKSSLLNAGVAPRLREEGYLPLIVRVNDVGRGPMHSVLDGIRCEAERQHVEYGEGVTDSLWSFFKSVELWRADLLLTPILIIDQFEELFTLHSEQARGGFLSQLSHLVRGVRPREMQIEGGLTERPPMIRVVLSLREDYLGLLDDAADYLPQILDHRFRLSPLTPDAAAEAIIGPAEIEDACLATRPFRYDREAVEVVLTYLSHRQATRSVPQTRQYVEPFQLQLVCQRVEQIVTERQRVEEGELIITTKDIGGESAIRETLKSFYTRSVGALPRRATRRAIRRLCQEFLISPEGRRLSLEEHEIYRQLQLTPEILQQLVKERLLRSEHRSASTYYELSHDALIDPVIATRRWQGLVSGWLGIGVASVPLVIITAIIIFQIIPNFFTALPGSIESVIVFTLVIVFLIRLFKNSLASLRRLRPSTPDELASVLGAGHDRMKFITGVSGAFFGLVSFLSAAAIILALIVGDPPEWTLFGHTAYTGVVEALRGNLVISDNARVEYVQQSVLQHGIGLDLITYFVSIPVMALAGLATARRGVRKLLGAPRYAAPAGTPRGLLLRLRGSFWLYRPWLGSFWLYRPWLTFRILGLVGSACVLLAALLAIGMESLLIVCSQFKGQLLERIPAHWFNLLTYDCSKAIDKGYWNDSRLFEWLYLILFITLSTGIFIRRLRGVYHFFGARSRRKLPALERRRFAS